jgi:hypothetical protein
MWLRGTLLTPFRSHAILSQGQSHRIASAPLSASSAPPVLPAGTTYYQVQKPSQRVSSSQILRNFQGGLPTVAAFAPSVQPPSQPLQNATSVHSNPLPQDPTAIHIIQRGELLQPQYAWMADQMRYHFNEKINETWNTAQDKSRPHDDRINAATFSSTCPTIYHSDIRTS